MPSRTELQAMLAQSRERFDAAVDGADPAALEEVAVCGVWTSRDVAGHLADWNNEFAAAVEHALDGPAPNGQPVEDGEAYNQSHAAARKSQPWSAAKADLDASVKRAAALLEELNDEQVSSPATQPWGEAASIAAVLSELAGHMDEHVVDLENGLPQ